MRVLPNVLGAAVLAAGAVAALRALPAPIVAAGAVAEADVAADVAVAPTGAVRAATAPAAAPDGGAHGAANEPTADDETLLLPDGTRVPTLNGARGAIPLAGAWPANVPFSAIVGVERSPAGVDWYVHADGSRSTTEMRWRADLGRDDAITRLARPAPRATPRVPASTH